MEFEVNFGEGENNSGWITVELASADEMPHTVYTFLEQVDKGLYTWGGTLTPWGGWGCALAFHTG